MCDKRKKHYFGKLVSSLNKVLSTSIPF